MKQEAWTKNKFDEVFAKKGRFEKANVTKQNAKYTPTVNTLVNIVQRNIKTQSKTSPGPPSSTESLGEVNRVPECPQGPATPSHNPLTR